MKNKRICAVLVVLTGIAVPRSVDAQNRYVQHNLVSDLPGLADRVDPDLVNPWGIATSSTSPFWIANNGSGLATVYNSSGVRLPVVAAVPAASVGSPSAPTGQVFNGTGAFVVAGAKSAVFLFGAEDGTISGWYPGIDKNEGVIAVNNSGAGAVYKGLAIGTTDAGPVLYAANFHSGAIDTFTGDFAPKAAPGGFVDPGIPAGFAPFNVYVAGNKVYVAYAKQDDDKEDDVAGDGNGYIDLFDTDGRLVQRLVTGGRLNSPWGMTLAPANFGEFSNALLVGNFGDGTINAYNPATGAYLGTLSDGASEKPIVIAGLWGLQFGNGGLGGDAAALYFTAGIPGPNGEAIESHGLFGLIQAAPVITAEGVVSAAGFQKGISPNSWVSIFGKNLSPVTRSWQQSDIVDGRLPTQLDGVGVSVDGKPAYVSYVSPTQINVLTPPALASSPVTDATRNGSLVSGLISVESQDVSPAFFQIQKYAVATNANGTSIVGPGTLIPGMSGPARAGDVIVLCGTGFGATDPPVHEGSVVTSPLSLVDPPAISIGGAPADVQFGGLTAPGLYQFNIMVPALPGGDAPILARTRSIQSPSGVFTSIDAPTAIPPESGAQIDNFRFSPNPADVGAGGKLTWTNKQDVVHTVVSDSGAFSSQTLGQNDTFSFTFGTPGTYSYHCSIHPFMKGQVVVE